MKKTTFKFKDFFRLLDQVHPKYWQLVVGTLLGSLGTLSGLIVPKMTGNLINTFRHISPGLVIGMIVLIVAGLIAGMFSGLVLGYFGQDVISKMRRLLWQKLLNLPVTYYDNSKTGEISSRLVNDTSQINNLLANTLPSAVTAVLQFIGSLVIMLTMDWQMTLIIVVAVPLITLLMLPIMAQSRKIGKILQDKLASLNSNSTTVLGEIRLVKASNGEETELTSGNADIKKLYDVGVKQAFINSLTSPIINMAMIILVVSILGYGVYRVMTGSMRMGDLVSFLMYLFQIMTPVIVVSQFFNELSRTSGATERISEILQEKEENKGTDLIVDISGKTLKVQDLTFSYEEGSPVLHGINFEAKPNTVVAFAGPSGGGKSTLFSMIERFYEPDSGQILIGNHDVSLIDLDNWRRQIGLVGQNSAVMPGTIRENLLYGLDSEVGEEQIWEALKMAYADGFIKEMEHGLETQIGERGVKLSGGQRQRIAIARAFLRNPKILMLDEATASLDSESEAMVQKALGKLMKNRTTLVIAHRLSTIVDANQIYFIDHGTVSDYGTHEELIHSTPLYAEYVRNQFKGIK
ncbi:multidrug resistance ABC transporter ATP binding protein [Lactobacillus pasteurii DSM 23907 = CRBIP 24.76]|uniref:Multidrug resistance ABC transporter ATP-binding and permease protein n=1 Tax=Lactobacillus pasteurii DSM 23907 = CRBIP 24.76 TaxID=1423790 RepID=I7KKS1_9LACO|nr:ABC transporter ATP-binding protein [Lactobacillus pasteurii]KRK07424.1 multidrug resistance ABC transporter ATP binding protein [Lactobacillus pasteurii DSM 23907 = CRBIP 24.76]TDG77635.1 hypothetical protein C5L33_000046 [Lactobacillus pasteurii]CCI84749.1 Xenobiotic-transporting ATPase [Lactobacillus pasteurii DSM 23907 = CRBIP 24.76]